MKRILIYIAAVALMFSFGACSEENGRTFDFDMNPSVGITFPTSAMNFALVPEDGGKISVPLYRGNIAEAASVQLTLTGGDGVFSLVKPTADFAAGENSTSVEVAFNLNDMGTDPVEVVIAAANAEDVAQTGNGKVTLTLQKQLTYVSIGEGVYSSSMFGESWPQEILKAEEGNYFIIPDAWVEDTDFEFYFDGETLTWNSTSTGFTDDAFEGELVFEINSWEILSTAPLTLELSVTYHDDKWAYSTPTNNEIIQFPEGFTF